MKKLFGAILIVFMTISIVKSQESNISIQFLGNCGFFFTDGDFSFYLDFPYKPGAHGYMEYNEDIIDTIQPSICIFTHGHSDHFKKSFFKKTKSVLYGPGPVRALVSGKRTITFKELNDTITDFSIQYFKTPHGFSFKHYSYLIEWHRQRIYISGDTHDKDHFLKLKDLDVAIVNSWLLMDISENKQKIDTKKIILCHQRKGDKITGTRDKFVVLEQYESLIIK